MIKLIFSPDALFFHGVEEQLVKISHLLPPAAVKCKS